MCLLFFIILITKCSNTVVNPFSKVPNSIKNPGRPKNPLQSPRFNFQQSLLGCEILKK